MKRALVLCGGGSLGSYEVGAWRFLHEHNLDHFDIVTGTSIGALNGAFVATGEIEKAEFLWNTIAADKVIAGGMNVYEGFLSDMDKAKRQKIAVIAKEYIKNGGVDITPLQNLVKQVIDPKKVLASKLTFGIVTTSYPALKEVDVVVNKLPENQVLDYLHASSACYPIFPVYKIGKNRFVDGGYHNNLPIDFAFRLGADEVVAVLLHSVPRKPQHPELMLLPNVQTVIPSHDTGSIMDFSHEVAKENLTLGYNDCAKNFGFYLGYLYTFEKEDLELAKAQEFLSHLVKEHYMDIGEIEKKLTLPEFPHFRGIDYYLRTIETLGDWLGIDYFPVYKISDFLKLAVSKIKEESQKPGALDYAKRHNFGIILSPKERKGFLIFLYDLVLRGAKSPRLDKLKRNDAEVYALERLFKETKARGLLNL
jgi:predicted acylesterase/phospholipase RssA